MFQFADLNLSKQLSRLWPETQSYKRIKFCWLHRQCQVLSSCYAWQSRAPFWDSFACSQLLGRLVLSSRVGVTDKWICWLSVSRSRLRNFSLKNITGFNKKALLVCETRKSQSGEIPRQKDTCAGSSFRGKAQSWEALLSCQVRASNVLCHNWVGVIITFSCSVSLLPACSCQLHACSGMLQPTPSYGTNSTGARGGWTENWGWTHCTGKTFAGRMQWWDVTESSPAMCSHAVGVCIQCQTWARFGEDMKQAWSSAQMMRICTEEQIRLTNERAALKNIFGMMFESLFHLIWILHLYPVIIIEGHS